MANTTIIENPARIQPKPSALVGAAGDCEEVTIDGCGDEIVGEVEGIDVICAV
jgi:hypothetical protein